MTQQCSDSAADSDGGMVTMLGRWRLLRLKGFRLGCQGVDVLCQEGLKEGDDVLVNTQTQG